LSHTVAALNYAVRRRVTQGDRVILSSTIAISLYSRNNCSLLSWKQTTARTLQEKECSSDCFRKFDSRRKSRLSQRRIRRDPGDPWKLLRPWAKAIASLLRNADPTLEIYALDNKNLKNFVLSSTTCSEDTLIYSSGLPLLECRPALASAGPDWKHFF